MLYIVCSAVPSPIQSVCRGRGSSFTMLESTAPIPYTYGLGMEWLAESRDRIDRRKGDVRFSDPAWIAGGPMETVQTASTHICAPV